MSIDGLCGCGCGGVPQLATQNETRRGYVKGEPIQNDSQIKSVDGSRIAGKDPEPRVEITITPMEKITDEMS